MSGYGQIRRFHFWHPGNKTGQMRPMALFIARDAFVPTYRNILKYKGKRPTAAAPRAGALILRGL
jgi:hypothetical protein